MGVFLLALLYIAPVVFIICMAVWWDSLTLQQWSIITMIFAVIPSMVKLLEILRRFRREGNQAIIDLGNCFRRHKHEKIGNWFRNRQYRLESILNASIIVIPLLFFLAGLVMQLLSTFQTPVPNLTD
jgi:hypothetical protein